MRFASKRQLLESIEHEHLTFLNVAATIPRARYRDARALTHWLKGERRPGR
jgi:hypothetical protein